MEDKKRVFTVLCIDGGGARGLIPARILKEIEDRTGKPIWQLFDIVAGTSTGSILGTALCIPHPEDPTRAKYKAEDLIHFYEKNLPEIFAGTTFDMVRNMNNTGAIYNPAPLDAAFLRAFEDIQLKDALANLVIPVADIEHNRPVYLEHYKDIPDASPEKWSTMKMRDAVRAACSAPIFFPAKAMATTPDTPEGLKSVMHHLIDGGLFSGNIPMDLMAQAKRMAPPDSEIIFVHLGTGITNFSKTADIFNKTKWKQRLSDIMSLFISMSMSATLDNMKREMGNRLFSIDDVMVKSATMNEGDLAAQKICLDHAEDVIHRHSKIIDRLCDILTYGTISDKVKYDGNSPLFFEACDAMKSADNVKALAEIYTRFEQDPDLATMLDHEKSELNNIFIDKMTGLLKRDKTMNAAREFRDELKRILDNIPLPIPRNDNKKPDAPVTAKKSLGRLCTDFFKACRRLVCRKLGFNKAAAKPATPETAPTPPPVTIESSRKIVKKNKTKPNGQGHNSQVS